MEKIRFNVENHPFMDDSRIVGRLIEDYEKYGRLSVAWDFDNTLFDYNNTGGDFSGIIKLAQFCSEVDYINNCLWTSNEGDKLTFCKLFCEHFKIKFDYINESPINIGQKTRKPFFSLLIDDRAGLETSVKALIEVINYIEKNKSNTSEN